MTLEKEIEKRFCQRVKAKGCMVIKLSSPGLAGVPDRLVIMPKGRAVFAEIKRPSGKPTALQSAVMRKLNQLGQEVWTIMCYSDIDVFMTHYFGKVDAPRVWDKE